MFLGLASILQAYFLPGALFVFFLKKTNYRFAILFPIIFIFSLAFNYVLVFFLLYFDLYIQKIVLIIFSAELILLLLLLLVNGKKINNKNIKLQKQDDIELNDVYNESKVIKYSYGIILGIAVALVLAFPHGIVYDHIDAINSWDIWAQSFANCQYPKTYGDYPQLTSILMSLPYVFMGSVSIQLFSILMIDLFIFQCLISLNILLKTEYRHSSITCSFLITWVYASNKVIIVDVAVSCIAILSFTLLLEYIRRLKQGDGDRLLLWAAFLAAGINGAIKQTGLIWCYVFAPVAIHQINNAGIERKTAVKSIVLPYFASVVFATSWYWFNAYLVYIGQVPTKIVSIFTNKALFGGYSYVTRAVTATFKYMHYSIFALAALRGLFIKQHKALSAVALLFFGGWLVFLSYGGANGKLPAILSAFCLGGYVKILAEKQLDRRIISKIKSFYSWIAADVFKRLTYIVSIFIFIVLIASFAASDKIDGGLLKASHNQILTIGEIGLTKRLNYLQNTKPQQVLTTDWRVMQLPNVNNGYYNQFSREAQLLDYGYLILNNDAMKKIDIEVLNDNFYLDYVEGQFSLYIRK
ncbi:MAG: hypothetical protein LBT62_03385 [Deltaproteobacteria bacterium]|nr:hypothetical protein [Deltaproteobacteria bacterium]